MLGTQITPNSLVVGGQSERERVVVDIDVFWKFGSKQSSRKAMHEPSRKRHGVRCVAVWVFRFRPKKDPILNPGIHTRSSGLSESNLSASRSLIPTPPFAEGQANHWWTEGLPPQSLNTNFKFQFRKQHTVLFPKLK